MPVHTRTRDVSIDVYVNTWDDEHQVNLSVLVERRSVDEYPTQREAVESVVRWFHVLPRSVPVSVIELIHLSDHSATYRASFIRTEEAHTL